LKIVAGDRVFVLLSEKLLVQEHIEIRRGGTRHLALIELDGADVLLTSKNELGLLLALRGRLPDRHRDGQHDGHHAQADKQSDHRVTVLTL
jgi:hypothetical protein